ncbi:MAG: transcriptional regulator [Polaromonas sp.]|uniref:transcriptional regulator n=1 Tax=Polaromonas sp. TaxID=1869339 RepID=UPI0032679C5F
MSTTAKNIPLGNSLPPQDSVVHSAAELGELVRERRRALALRQTEVAGLGNTGNRFIVELERGKPTVQLQKALDVLSLLGLEVVVRPKTGSQP